MNRKGHWIRAKGYDIWQDIDLEEGRHTCILCGAKWRPDGPPYIAIYGKVHEVKGVLCWESWAGIYPVEDPRDPVFKYICPYHRDRGPVAFDCVIGVQVLLLPPLTRMQNYLLDIRYWTLTILRFIWSYSRERLLYIMHPIKYIKMKRLLKRLGME